MNGSRATWADVSALAQLGVSSCDELHAIHTALAVQYYGSLPPVAVCVHPNMGAGGVVCDVTRH